MKCKNCGSEFTEKYSKLSNGDFCKKECARSYSRKQCKTGIKLVKCIICKKNIEVPLRASPNLCKCDNCRSFIKNKNLTIKIKKKEKFCLDCNKSIHKYTNKSGYCKTCFLEKKKKENYINFITRWKNELENGMKGSDSISNYIRIYLFKKYNNKCCKCGWGETNKKSGKIPLQIEHKDGNYKNNKEENLELLCPNCHSLTETYMGLNRGNGRKQRYKETY